MLRPIFWDGSNNNNWFNNGNWSLNHPPSILENADVSVLPFARIANPGVTARSLSVGTNSGETGEIRVTDDGTLSVGSAWQCWTFHHWECWDRAGVAERYVDISSPKII